MYEKVTETELAEIVNNYPLPWTFAALGEQKYLELDARFGYGARGANNPDLAPPAEVVAAFKAAPKPAEKPQKTA